MAKYPVGPDELNAQLRDQARFLARSCEAFDAGDAAEAKRIATSIRVLVHDTGASTSLLQQLSLKDKLRFVSLAIPNSPGNLGLYCGLLDIELTRGQYLPKLDQLKPRETDFADWWSESVLKDGDGTLYTRKDLVLALANKDGGAHVDPELDEAYQKLSRENHVGVEVAVGGKPVQWRANPVLPSVRQMGHELLRTFGVRLRSEPPEEAG